MLNYVEPVPPCDSCCEVPLCPDCPTCESRTCPETDCPVCATNETQRPGEIEGALILLLCVRN